MIEKGEGSSEKRERESIYREGRIELKERGLRSDYIAYKTALSSANVYFIISRVTRDEGT